MKLLGLLLVVVIVGAIFYISAANRTQDLQGFTNLNRLTAIPTFNFGGGSDDNDDAEEPGGDLNVDLDTGSPNGPTFGDNSDLAPLTLDLSDETDGEPEVTGANLADSEAGSSLGNRIYGDDCPGLLIADSRVNHFDNYTDDDIGYPHFQRVLNRMTRVADGRDNQRCQFTFRIFNLSSIDRSKIEEVAALCDSSGVDVFADRAMITCRAEDENGNYLTIILEGNPNNTTGTIAAKGRYTRGHVSGKAASTHYEQEFSYYTIERHAATGGQPPKDTL